MSTAAQSTPPADRYGHRPADGLGRGAKAAIAAALAVAVALAAWFALTQHRADPVTADVVSFRVLDAEQVEIDFQVSMPPGTTAVCRLTALSSTFAQVGVKEVPVGPAETGSARYATTVRTSQLADAVDIAGCTPD